MSQEAKTNLSASNQQCEVVGAATNDLPLVMICLGHVYDDLSFRTAVYNTVRHIHDTPPLPPSDGDSRFGCRVRKCVDLAFSMP